MKRAPGKVSAHEPAIELRAEAELLLRCARFAFEADDRRCVHRIVASGVDWDRLFGLAERNGLVQALYQRLSSLDPNPVPKAVFVRLWELHVSRSQRARAITAELLGLLRLLEEGGVPALPFKGPALADLLYGDVTLREYGDLDILVPVRELPHARDLVEARGYESEFPLRPRQQRQPLDDPMHYSLMHRNPETGLLLELHWSTDCRLFALPGIDDGWWERRPFRQFQHTTVRSLTPEELLYVLCMHGTRHHWSILSQLRDVAGTIRRYPDLDWRKVFEISEGQGTLRVLLLSAELAQRVLEAKLPGAVLRRIAADRFVPAMATEVMRRSGVTTEPTTSASGRLAFEIAWFRFWPRWLRYGLGRSLLPNMADWSRWDLPHGLSFLYLPLHVVRLCSKYCTRPGRGFIN